MERDRDQGQQLFPQGLTPRNEITKTHLLYLLLMFLLLFLLAGSEKNISFAFFWRVWKRDIGGGGRTFLHSPGWPGTLCVPGWLRSHKDPPTSVSGVLG